MSRKKVYRKYFSKKLNKWVQYEYYADKYTSSRKKRSPVLVSKSGKIYTERVKDLLDNTTDPGFRANIEDAIKQRSKDNKSTSRTKDQKRALTIDGVIAAAQKSNIATMIMNTGYSVEEAAEELGVSESELLDESNWAGNTFKPASKAFIFTYTGAIFA